jgi:multiple sugar transport system permease protein
MMVTRKVKTASILQIFLKYFILIFFAFWTILPLVSCIITSLKNTEEYQSTSVMVLPKLLYFKNFLEAFTLAGMGRAFLNSFVVLVFVLSGSILISSQLAYILNRFKFPGNTLIRRLFLFATLLPGVAMQVSVYSIMGKLGLINHLYGYIIMMMGTDVISIYIFIQFMEDISVSLDESAVIDGASYFKIYWNIILPLLKPATVTSLILKGVSCYNEYYCANLYLQDVKIRSVSISLYIFTGPLGNKYNLICAGVIISMIPAFIVFILCQKQIYSGITSGAVKG